MSSRPNPKRRLPIATRLTLWYTAMFTASTFLALAVIYGTIHAIVRGSTDSDLREDIEELSELWTNEGPAAFRAEADKEVKTEGADKVFYRIVDRSGSVLLATDLSHWAGLASAGETFEHASGAEGAVLETRRFSGHDVDTRLAYGSIDARTALQIGVSLEDDERFLGLFRSVFAFALPIIPLLAAFPGWFMTRKALQGVRDVTAAAVDIIKGDLTRRVPDTGGTDEVDLLARTFNAMLDRIEGLVRSMREMTDNIAHDLRSPLTRIRGVAESALMNGSPGPDPRALTGDIIEECDRLMHMINTMLDITETESGTATLDCTVLDMQALVADACELMRPLAEDKGLSLRCRLERGAFVYGNTPLLQRMIGNLLDNAIKYTASGGEVEVSLERNGDWIALALRDTGVGIPETETEKVFERFYRGDDSRSAQGSGLGLSLALAVARAHHGDISLSSVAGAGSTFTVALPALPALKGPKNQRQPT